MKWSETAKVLSRLFRLCKQAEYNPKGGTEISSNEFKMLSSLVTDDLHGNSQADILANEGTAAHGDLEPEATWLQWADFANFWRGLRCGSLHWKMR
eukprot:2847521-Amphidinium_carterae.1